MKQILTTVLKNIQCDVGCSCAGIYLISYRFFLTDSKVNMSSIV